MTNIRSSLLVCVLAFVLTPAEGHAFSWWRLNKLSGPRFQGVASEVRLKCWATPGAEPAFDNGNPRNLMPGVIWSICPKNLRRRHSLNLDVAALASRREAEFAEGNRIYLSTIGASFSSRPNEVIEVGTGVHAASFYADGIAPVHKLMLEPIRLDIRPFQNRWRWTETAPSAWWREAIVVRTGLVWFPSGFAANELGPIADDDALVGHVGLFLDVGF